MGNSRHQKGRVICKNSFANNIEGAYKDLLLHIVDRAQNMTPWEKENCHFITLNDIVTFSIFMAFQDVRVKSIRQNVEDTSNCIQQILADLGANERTINEYKISASASKLIHGRMIFNSKEICDIAHIFSNHHKGYKMFSPRKTATGDGGARSIWVWGYRSV